MTKTELITMKRHAEAHDDKEMLWLIKQAERLSELEKTDCSVCSGKGYIDSNRPNVKCYQCYGSGIIYV